MTSMPSLPTGIQALLFSGLSLLGSSNAFADPSVHTYWVRIPGTAQTCMQEAQALGERFENQTGQTVIKTECKAQLDLTLDGKTYPIYSIALDYESLNALTPTSFVFGHDGSAYTGMPVQGWYGAFATYEGCVAQIPARMSEFEAQAGFAAITAGCEPAEEPFRVTYVMRLEGFGTPKNRLQVADVGHMISDENPIVAQRLVEWIQSQGLSVVHQEGLRAYYYSPESLPIGRAILAYTESEEECAAQLQLGASVLNAAGIAHGPTYCRDKTLEAMTLGDNFMHDEHANEGVSSYYTFTECMNDRERVLGAYLAKRQQPFGAVCESTYEMVGPRYAMRVYLPFMR